MEGLDESLDLNSMVLTSIFLGLISMLFFHPSEGQEYAPGLAVTAPTSSLFCLGPFSELKSSVFQMLKSFFLLL